jgi:hypothetical protein
MTQRALGMTRRMLFFGVILNERCAQITEASSLVILSERCASRRISRGIFMPRDLPGDLFVRCGRGCDLENIRKGVVARVVAEDLDAAFFELFERAEAHAAPHHCWILRVLPALRILHVAWILRVALPPRRRGPWCVAQAERIRSTL